MHTKDLLKTPEFHFRQGGRERTFAELMPDFSVHDRIGLVAWRPGGIMELAPLMLASIGAFYEELLQTSDSFYEYPDVFGLNVGGLHGYHGQLDIWPERRDPVLPSDPNAVVGMISDLGLTRLIIQDAGEAGGLLERESVTQLARQLRTILRVGGATTSESWEVTPSKNAATLIELTAESSASTIGGDAAMQAKREAGASRMYTPIDLEEALRMICSCGTTPENFGMSKEYLSAHGAGQSTIDRHTYEVSCEA